MLNRDDHFKTRFAYVERNNDARYLKAVFQKRNENQQQNLQRVELRGNNMRMQNMNKENFSMKKFK